MILLDLSQVMLSTLHAQLQGHVVEVDENLLRHMILNTIRANYKKFKSEFGELIICTDSTNNWRKQNYPYYKANRKKGRDESKLDWNAIFTSLNKIRDEIKDYFPYRVINVQSAEADDVIGTLCHKFGTELGGEPILILSGDKDFKQLQKYSNVSQWDPTRKRSLRTNDPEGFLYEHIIRGDASDGIPNFLSSDDCLVTDERQKSIMSKKLEVWLKQLKEVTYDQVFDDEKLLRGFKRNQFLIDLDYIPNIIQDEVIEQYNNEEGKTRTKMFNYFIKYKLKHLHESIGDF